MSYAKQISIQTEQDFGVQSLSSTKMRQHHRFVVVFFFPNHFYRAILARRLARDLDRRRKDVKSLQNDLFLTDSFICLIHIPANRVKNTKM